MLSRSILDHQCSSELHIENVKDSSCKKIVMMMKSIPEKQLYLSVSEKFAKYKKMFVGFG